MAYRPQGQYAILYMSGFLNGMAYSYTQTAK
ncbi:hypothetical protein A2U01_0108189, partial [Trifolium medium]|nr:hypothetical protein [Trifolium medium]